jgi:hypothetical protein
MQPEVGYQLTIPSSQRAMAWHVATPLKRSRELSNRADVFMREIDGHPSETVPCRTEG